MVVFAAASASAQNDAPRPIRVWGYDGMRPVMQRWEAGFERTHPGVHFANTFHGAAAAPAGLYDGIADIAVLGREWWPVDNMAFHWVFQYAPFGVNVVATGTRAPAPSFTPVVIVNIANPIRQISLEQLDAVFGAQHLAAPANVRVWRELGVGGELADQAIEPVGFGEDEPLGVFFRKRVLHNDYKPNPASALIETHYAGKDIAQRVARDRNALGYTSGGAASMPGVKVIPVVDAKGEPVQATAESIGGGEYPLTRTLALYVNRKPGERLPKDIEEFLEFVLSDSGQKLVTGNEGFVPLSPAARHKQAARITGDWTTAARNPEWKE